MAGLLKVVLLNSNIADEAPAAKKKEDLHVPAKNIGDIKSAEKVRITPVLPTCMYTVFLQSGDHSVRFYFKSAFDVVTILGRYL